MVIGKRQIRLRLSRERGDHPRRERSLGWPDDMPGTFAGLSNAPVTPSSGLAIADAYACIRALSDAAASLPLIAYRRIAQGRERLSTGLLAELLNRPAPGMTQANLTGQVVCHLNLSGNAYVGKYRDGGRISQLGLLDPGRVDPRLEAGEPVYLYTPPRGQRVRLTTRDVVHIRALSADGIVGLSPVR